MDQREGDTEDAKIQWNKVPKYKQMEHNADLTNFLAGFEDHMASYMVQRCRWPMLLAPLFNEKVTQVYQCSIRIRRKTMTPYERKVSHLQRYLQKKVGGPEQTNKGDTYLHNRDQDADRLGGSEFAIYLHVYVCQS